MPSCHRPAVRPLLCAASIVNPMLVPDGVFSKVWDLVPIPTLMQDNLFINSLSCAKRLLQLTMTELIPGLINDSYHIFNCIYRTFVLTLKFL